MFKYIAILEGSNEMLGAYTLDGIRKAVEMASYKGKWRIFELHEVS